MAKSKNKSRPVGYYGALCFDTTTVNFDGSESSLFSYSLVHVCVCVRIVSVYSLSFRVVAMIRQTLNE